LTGVRVFLESLGCKLNQAETDELFHRFAEAGCCMVSSPAEADIYILNTCTVTHVADRKSRHLLRMTHRSNPNALLVATGCYAERAPQELLEIDGVKFILGNKDKPNLLSRLGDSGFLNKPARGGGFQPAESSYGFQTRAMVKVQDGCSNFCTYCIVPLVRGRETSHTPDQVVDTINKRAVMGYREVVLTGVRIGSYHSNGIDLCGLLERILHETDVERLRLSSLQPSEISPRLISIWQNERMCPHFHLCLQSGSDSILERMRRCYSTAEFEQTVSSIRNALPDVAITTDVMVGFPGESHENFEQSYDFCRRMEFSRIHVFSYSPRKGTEASRFPHQLDERVKKKRADRMLWLAGDSTRAFMHRFSGNTLRVLFERVSEGVWNGLTDNYIRVYARDSGDMANRFQMVKLIGLYRNGMWGKVIK
jgi:threonylcarbamoyladenosine tRNA methylthiotransferase MtaB